MYTEKEITGIGKAGEDFVADYLRNRGLIVIKQNFSSPYGEIDIIAEDDNYIVFVEVKTRKIDPLVKGVESINLAKIQRIMNLSNDFLNKFSSSKPPRFDVAEVTYKDVEKPEFQIEYIESAF